MANKSPHIEETGISRTIICIGGWIFSWFTKRSIIVHVAVFW